MPDDDMPPVLVVNAGSSSLKVKLLPQGFSFLIERLGGVATASSNLPTPPKVTNVKDHAGALQACLDVLEVGAHGHIERAHGRAPLRDTLYAVGHRVVHGGERFREPTLLTEEVIGHIDELAALAPLHNPPNVSGIRAARQLLPTVPQVAVFDTAFHATLPPHAFLYGLPYAFYREGIRRYGFHGTSFDFVTRQSAALLRKPLTELKLIALHLGNGASAAAVANGVSVDTTMGLTPLEGLLMGTRTGDLDPGVLLHLLRQGYSSEDLENLLNKQSGLLGLSGVSNDMRDVRRAAEDGNEQAQAALAVFCYRIRKTVGAYAVAMGGLDAIVFTGGIGEHDAATRVESLRGLEFLGIELNEARNSAAETVISTDDSPVVVMVIPTDEEAMIAQATLTTIKDADKGKSR